MGRSYKKKFTFLLSSILLFPIFINKSIFIMTKKLMKNNDNKYYNWKLGNISYNIQGTGKPILLVHGIGIGCSGREWDNNVYELSLNYKVYTIDLLGFGCSDKPKMTYTSYMYSQLINDFIKDIIKKPVYIVSSSASTIFVTIACISKPNNFNKILMIEPNGINNKTAENKNKWTLRLTESPILGTTIYNIMASKLYCKYNLNQNLFYAKERMVTNNLIKCYYNNAHIGGENNKFPIASFINNYMNMDMKMLLKQLNVPLYVVFGENSNSNTNYNINVIQSLKANTECAVFEKTRLLPHYENPTEFNKLTKNFFR